MSARVPAAILTNVQPLMRALTNIVTNALKVAHSRVDVCFSIRRGAALANHMARGALGLVSEKEVSEISKSLDNELFNHTDAPVLLSPRTPKLQSKSNQPPLVGSWLRVEVHDDGPGLSPDLATAIFTEPFVANRFKTACVVDEGVGKTGGGILSERSFLSPGSSFELLSDEDDGLIELGSLKSVTLSPYRAHGGKFADRQGSGLGLFITNMCLKELGGARGFHSYSSACTSAPQPPGEEAAQADTIVFPRLGGAVFWFEVPLVESPVDPGGVTAALELGPSFVKSKLHLSSEAKTNDDQDDRVTAAAVAAAEARCLSYGKCTTGFATKNEGGSFAWTEPDEAVVIFSDVDESPAGTEPLAQIATNNIPSTLIPEAKVSTSRGKSRVPKDDRRSTPTGGRILVVDDSPMVLKLVARSLSKLNFEVFTASNGQEGLKMMKEACFQAVLMDFLMPVMDGITATELFRNWECSQITEGLRRGIQGIIGVSANAELADIATAISVGMQHVLPKPIKVCKFYHSNVNKILIGLSPWSIR